jgi:glyoxylate reductase
MTGDILIAEELKDLLELHVLTGHDVEWIAAGEPTPSGSFRALIPLLSRKIGAAELDGLPKLAIVANCAVGFDNIDLAAAATRGVFVTNTPHVLTESTADLTWTLILAAARRTKEGQRLLEEGEWGGWDPTQLLGLELHGRTVGIIGAGQIGQAVGRRAVGFGMRILYMDEFPRPEFESETRAQRVELHTLLSQADVVTIHVPLTTATEGMIGRAQLLQMKQEAVLVNTARGGIVDESALLEALDGGGLMAAGLDVFVGEPAVNPVLVRHPRVTCLPHLGSATWDTRRAMANLAAQNVQAVLAGEPPLTPVSR